MPHSFVIAKLVPKRSAMWTSYYGIQKAADLATRPFLALHVSATDLGLGDPEEPERYSTLFLVSPEKPTGLKYFTLTPRASGEKRALVVNPSLHPEGRSLYVHTFPELHEDEVIFGAGVANDATIGPHYLDKPSFRTFCRSVMKDRHNRMQLKQSEILRGQSLSGGDDAIEDGWDTWSGKSSKERFRDPMGCVYEHLHFKNLPLWEPPSIYRELLLYKQ